MLGAALVELKLGLKAERRPLEELAMPLASLDSPGVSTRLEARLEDP
jgi:hypothetical protein